MVSTILAMIQICVGGGDIKNQRGEIFDVRSCHITTQIFIPLEFSEKKFGGRSWSGAPIRSVTVSRICLDTAMLQRGRGDLKHLGHLNVFGHSILGFN